MKHRFAAALTALTLLTLPAAVLPAGAPLTAQAESLGELTYAVYTDHVVITDCDKAAVSVTIPEEIDGLPVTGIGWHAFMSCTSLSTIVIPESVTSIGYGAFSDTAWYDSQPDGMVYAGRVAYGYKGTCTGEIVLRPDTAGIADECFSGQKELTSVTIPEGVTSIGEDAFKGCTGLTSVTIPEGVKSIWNFAFYGCTSLTSVTIPESVTSIGVHAVYGTPFLEEKRAEDPLVIFGQTVYDGTTCVGDVVIPESVTSISYYAFSCAADVTSITVLNPACEMSNAIICQSMKDEFFFANIGDEYASHAYYSYFYGTIYGYEGSTAQEYVNSRRTTFDYTYYYGYKFVSIESQIGRAHV